MKNSDSSHCTQASLLPLEGACDSVAGSLPPIIHPPQAAAEDAVAAANGASVPDLRAEAANMMRLALAQEGADTPLSISSRQAQVVLGQF